MRSLLLRLAGAGVALLAYASLVERNAFVLRRHRVPCLPPGSYPMGILHVSDLHLRTQQGRKQAFLRRIGALDPDLVVGTGDFLGDADSVAATVDTMRDVRGRVASLFVLGSNDYYGPKLKSPLEYFRERSIEERTGGPPNPWRDLIRELEGAGWTNVCNRSLSLDGIDVVGLDDPHIGLADLSVAEARDGDGFRLAVVHSPDAAPDLAALGYDLILCGHTHGGQVRIPGVGALVTNSTLPPRMARGLHRLNGAWLHVCAGLGTSMYAPVRFACRPEACLLELVPREAG